MKKNPFLFFLAALFLTGCGSTSVHRARQYSPDWDETTRERITKGVIANGDTRLMVYIAIGAPLYSPKLTDDDLEKWEYIGKIEKLPALSTPAPQGAIRFSSSNDTAISNPFASGSDSARNLVLYFGADEKLFGMAIRPTSTGARAIIKLEARSYALPQNPRTQTKK